MTGLRAARHRAITSGGAPSVKQAFPVIGQRTRSRLRQTGIHSFKKREASSGLILSWAVPGPLSANGACPPQNGSSPVVSYPFALHQLRNAVRLFQENALPAAHGHASPTTLIKSGAAFPARTDWTRHCPRLQHARLPVHLHDGNRSLRRIRLTLPYRNLSSITFPMQRIRTGKIRRSMYATGSWETPLSTTPPVIRQGQLNRAPEPENGQRGRFPAVPDGRTLIQWQKIGQS